MKTDYFEKLENPFILDIEDKKEYNFDDFVEIQQKLKDKNLDIFLETLYPTEKMITSFEEMKRRTTRGITQSVIDISTNVVPRPQLFKIGNGGNGKKCFVCSTPFFGDRCDASQTMLRSLEEVGYNGHFLLLNGGFPNPTGTETKYAGVPYSFKIFMILEAKNMGFDQVIWLDAACYAVNNPDPLFDLVNTYDAVFRSFSPNCFLEDVCNNVVFPKTIELLNTLVDRDIRNDRNVNSIVFGLNLQSIKINKFIDEYYEMVKLGLPFLSSFPEEIVFSSIFNKPEYEYLFNNHDHMYSLYIHSCYSNFEQAKNNGYYFVQRQY